MPLTICHKNPETELKLFNAGEFDLVCKKCGTKQIFKVKLETDDLCDLRVVVSCDNCHAMVSYRTLLANGD